MGQCVQYLDLIIIYNLKDFDHRFKERKNEAIFHNGEKLGNIRYIVWNNKDYQAVPVGMA